MFRRSIKFLDPGPLRDGELELVPPDPRLADAMLAAVNHPVTLAMEPHEPRLTRQNLADYFAAVPRGHMMGDASRGRVPHYDFWMYVHDFPREPGDAATPPIFRIGGTITLRIGQTPAIELYYGHVGYHVFPPLRGRHVAERACRLLLPLARRHHMQTLWITCDPKNAASKRTCERLGMHYHGVVQVPQSDPLYARGEREKCRYRLDL
jgi:tagatose 1,6-diphosphate aldolase